jgi:hypothetical protein
LYIIRNLGRNPIPPCERLMDQPRRAQHGVPAERISK